MTLPSIRRILAPNPGPLTGTGTNTWIIGSDPVVVIDPGPLIASHLDAILETGRIEAILVTHAHLDHSALASRLGPISGAPVLAFGSASDGRPRRAEHLTDLGGGEGVDDAFAPDGTLADGAVVETAMGLITALHTPGHFGNHMAFALGDTVFCGDLVMGWATTLISPPDGDLAAFRTSCGRLRDRAPRALLPGHGEPVTNPRARIDELLRHRDQREAQIVAALSEAPGTAAALAARVYTDITPHLLPAAARNVLAHLIDLAERGDVVAPEGITERAVFHAT